nr:MAG TPA: hypothetical protein [Caudoviricetes sp.]
MRIGKAGERVPARSLLPRHFITLNFYTVNFNTVKCYTLAR